MTATALWVRGDLADGEPAPPDLRLEWQDRGRGASLEGAPVHGPAGETISIPYRLRNVGGSEAFAVILDARTALGAVGRAIRLQPGPAAGDAVDRTLKLPLARGMRELCIDARLQTLDPGLPTDPHPEDNRICRKVEIVEEEAGTGFPLTGGAGR